MTSPRPRLVAVVVLIVSALAAWLAAPHRAPALGGMTTDAERYFRVEVDPDPVPRGGWAVQGYVYSSHRYRVNGVRLQVDVLDADGQLMQQVYGWVAGDVPAGGRAYFYVSVPKRGAAYRARVVSYFLVSREAS
jgi:hypothetical protein